MPDAAHHEMKIKKLENSRFSAVVQCTGCNFQAHCLPEEDPEHVKNLHQQKWGYTPKAAKSEAKPEIPHTMLATPAPKAQEQPKVAPVVPPKPAVKNEVK